MATNPTLLVQPIAANGAKNVIPNTTTTAGAMSQDQGFPAETSLPLGAGGVAPSREDFNGAFNLLSAQNFMLQKGWIFTWDATQAYYAGCIVRDTTDGALYECISDVAAGGSVPSADSTNWQLYNVGLPAELIPAYNKRDIITTSGTYTAPVTGWYKITVKGGGGGGGAGGNYTSPNIGVGGDGGGEGGTTIAYEYMTLGDTATVVIGAGGSKGTVSTTPAADGGNSTVTINSNTYTGGGGGGGSSHYNNLPAHGIGGTGTIAGASGCSGDSENNASIGRGDTGGGTGGAVGASNISSGGDAPNPIANSGGGGGGGANSSQGAGKPSDGADGFVWFEYFDASSNP